MALLALASAFAYGASDFLAGVAARRVAVLRATTVTYLVGTVSLAVVTWLVPGAVTARAVLAGAVAGVFAAVGLLAFYAVLASGPMGVLSPAIAVLQAGVPVAAGVAMGERLGVGAWAGIALALAAAWLLGSSGEHAEETTGSHWSPRVIVLTLVSGVGLGLSVVALDAAPEDAGLVPAFADLAVGLVLLAIFEALARRWTHAARLAEVLDGGALAERPGGVRAPWSAVGAGVLMGAAQGLLMLALHGGELAIVAALLATYPLATVILARFVLRERFSGRTVVGIVAALVAAGLLAAG